MLELLLLLPFIVVSILSMTFDIYLDEFSNVNRGNIFHYDALGRDAGRAAKQRPIYFNLILTGDTGIGFIPECATSKEDTDASVNDWMANGQLDDVINFLMIENKQYLTDTKAETPSDKEAGNSPRNIIKICLEGEIVHNQMHQRRKSESSNRRWKPPV